MSRVPLYQTSRTTLLVLVSLAASYASCGGASSQDTLGPVPMREYITGRFEPAKHPQFVRLDKIGVPTSRPMLLRQDAAKALRELYRDFHKAHPKVEFRIVSATRNFGSQRAIWEAKWSGRTKVDGKELPKAIPDGLSRGRAILRYSSMPGTSRHHWGTDVDITSLENGYFSRGNGLILYTWLQRNAARYGFCQPYTAGRRGGYEEERWHWSYKPVASMLQSEWSKQFSGDPVRSLSFAKFEGAELVRSLAPQFVETVNADCK